MKYPRIAYVFRETINQFLERMTEMNYREGSYIYIYIYICITVILPQSALFH
jgi:hypothetical protein